jgi:hypothetical protein
MKMILDSYEGADILETGEWVCICLNKLPFRLSFDDAQQLLEDLAVCLGK